MLSCAVCYNTHSVICPKLTIFNYIMRCTF